jgi:hypothetical protein
MMKQNKLIIMKKSYCIQRIYQKLNLFNLTDFGIIQLIEMSKATFKN